MTATLPMPPENASPSALTVTALDAVQDAARLGLSLREDNLLNAVNKSRDANDWFTEADGGNQDLLHDRLPAEMPDGTPIAFEGEEKKGRKLRPAMSQFSYRWIIDPIDGTKPFKNGGHEWAVSAALQKRRSPSERIIFGDKWETVTGVLYCSAPGDSADNMKGTLYWAEKDKDGAYAIDCATGEQRRLGRPATLGTTLECNVAADPALPNPEKYNPVSDAFAQMLREGFSRHALTPTYARSIVHTAIQALEGQKHATLFEIAAHDWDIAALKLIAEKSGVFSHIEPLGNGLYSTRVTWDGELFRRSNLAAAQTVCEGHAARL